MLSERAEKKLCALAGLSVIGAKSDGSNDCRSSGAVKTNFSGAKETVFFKRVFFVSFSDSAMESSSWDFSRSDSAVKKKQYITICKWYTSRSFNFLARDKERSIILKHWRKKKKKKKKRKEKKSYK